MENDSDCVEQPNHPTVDDEAYEPTYAEAFPPLPMPGLENGDTVTDSANVISPWGSADNRMAVRTSSITQARPFD
jgi:hypothetical protein